MEAGKPGLKRLIIQHKTVKNVRLCPVTKNSVTFDKQNLEIDKFFFL